MKNQNVKTRTVFKVGILIFCSGFLLDMLFIQFGIVGYLREGARLAVWVGLALMILGGVQRLWFWVNRKKSEKSGSV